MRRCNRSFQLAALATALLAACGSGGEEKAEPAKTEPAKTEPVKTEPAKAEPAAPAAPPEFGALAGVWEKTDFADRGMRVEFKPEGAFFAAAVTVPPPADAAAIDHFAARQGGDKGRGEASAKCVADSWKPGEVKFSGLEPDAAGGWIGQEALRAFAQNPCLMMSPRARKVRIVLAAPDRLAVTPAEIPKGKSPQPNVWRKVDVQK